MADYSGAWHCDECHASGTNYAGLHKPWCSMSEKLAKSAREKQLREQAVRNRINEQRADWEAMTDSEMLETMLALDKTLAGYEALTGILRENRRIGLTVLVARGLFRPMVAMKHEGGTHGDGARNGA